MKSVRSNICLKNQRFTPSCGKGIRKFEFESKTPFFSTYYIINGNIRNVRLLLIRIFFYLISRFLVLNQAFAVFLLTKMDPNLYVFRHKTFHGSNKLF